MPGPEELPYALCRELLASGVIGRVGICTPSGPRIFPVNYSLVGESVVFRTTPYSVLGTYAWQFQLAFEVDQFDHPLQRGWSVMATGYGRPVDDPAELAAIRALDDPVPWATGDRPRYVRLVWDELAGRQLGSEDPRHALPVRGAL